MMSIGINSSGGGVDTGISGNGIVEKNYTLELSNKIKNILENSGINVFMIRDKDVDLTYDKRIDLINKNLEKNSIVLSNTLSSNSDIEVIYALRDDDRLASMLANSLSMFSSVKYYQYRWPTNSSKDYYLITRETQDYQTIIIRYGNPKTDKYLSNIDEIANQVSKTLLEYLGVEYKESSNYYVVKSGDTLYGIAKKYNITVDKLKDINNLKSSLIHVGDKLIIDTNKYVVKSGDTLYGIAKKYNTTVDKLKNINNLKSDFLSINQVLIVP